MNKNLEKAKDILYNLSDYIIIFSIIIGIAFIIGWRLDILFPQTTALVEPNTVLQSQNSGSKLVEKIDSVSADAKEETNNKIDQSSIVKVSIPSGTPSSNIGAILLDLGLITSIKDFEAKVNELNLETKLRFGEFDISKDSSLESIVKIIAHQK
nr:hypothetical protein [Tissierella sp.]